MKIVRCIWYHFLLYKCLKHIDVNLRFIYLYMENSALVFSFYQNGSFFSVCLLICMQVCFLSELSILLTKCKQQKYSNCVYSQLMLLIILNVVYLDYTTEYHNLSVYLGLLSSSVKIYTRINKVK